MVFLPLPLVAPVVVWVLVFGRLAFLALVLRQFFGVLGLPLAVWMLLFWSRVWVPAFFFWTQTHVGRFLVCA